MEDLTGKQFGYYQIVAPLGEGGMAAVYKAYQPSMERYVAVKVLPRHMATSEEFVNRFRREAKLLAQLQHPHILPVFDYGEAEGYPYIVMPFVNSGTLSELLQKRHLSLPEVRRIMTQLADALSYAHTRGMIHRDIKPSNVLIDERGNCLLTDFGLARMAEASTKITTSGTVMGTPAYMSPEQGAGSDIDHRSDIYSLGIMFYEMVTGRVPYTAETPVAIVFKHIQDPLPSARKLNPNLPEAVELVLLKALAKNPDDRYQTADDFGQAIQRAISDTYDDKTQIAEQKISIAEKATEVVAIQKKGMEAVPDVVLEKENNAPKSSKLIFGLISGLILLAVLGFGAFKILPTVLKTPASTQPSIPPTRTLVPEINPTIALSTPTNQPLLIQLTDFKVGQVTDLGGIDDKSFNAGAYAGIEKAVADLKIEGKYLESTQQSDYQKNIQQYIDEDTDLIITVGFLLGVDTAIAAKANPDTKFAIVDYSYPDCFGDPADEGKTCGSTTELANVLGLTFQTDEAAFLAGYAAAASTQTGKVATFGGINIPPVTIFMKGFEAGVAYYNAQKGTAVEVLGWNTAAGEGSFTGNFDSLDDGRSFAESFVQEGADIVMPVAGPVGLGSAAYCQETGSCKVIGVDKDWTVSAAEYTDIILTSVLKNVNVAVYDATKAAVDGTFKGGVYLGTLANGGVGLAAVNGASAELTAELEKLQADIISGAVKVSQ